MVMSKRKYALKHVCKDGSPVYWDGDKWTVIIHHAKTYPTPGVAKAAGFRKFGLKQLTTRNIRVVEFIGV